MTNVVLGCDRPRSSSDHKKKDTTLGRWLWLARWLSQGGRLRCCPWCRCEPVIVIRGLLIQVKCVNEDCPVGPETGNYARPKDALDDWEKRPLDKEEKR